MVDGTVSDLYALLGVSTDATLKEIRAAYREKSKTAHPDAGGDAELFNELKHACDTLSDPERRARYDATGDARPPKAETNPNTRLYDTASELIAQVIEKGVNPALDDVLAAAIKLCQERLPKARDQVAKIEKGIAALKNAVERIAPGDDGEENPLRRALEYRISLLEKHVKEQTEGIAFGDEVVRFLLEYKYRVDPTLPSPSRQRSTDAHQNLAGMGFYFTPAGTGGFRDTW